MKMKFLTIWFLGCSLLISQLSADGPVREHDLALKSGIGYEITGTDPYFVYSLPPRCFPSQTVILEIKTEAKAGLPSSFTLDLFWATARYGFGEEHKVSFRIPRGTKTTKWRLDIRDIALRRQFDSSSITSIRLDPNLEVGETLDFVFALNEGSAPEIANRSLLPYDFTEDPLLLNTGMEILEANNIGALDGQFKVLEGDPYFIFDLDQSGLDLEQTDALLIDFNPDFSQQRLGYFEIFWSDSNHGFGETYKAFFLYPIQNGPVLVNLGEFLHVVEPDVSRITGLRIDIPSPFPSPFHFEVIAVNSRTMRDRDTPYKHISLRYSIRAELLNKPDITEFSFRESMNEFLGRMGDEWFFFLFYGLIQLGLLVLIVNMFFHASRLKR